MIDELLEIQAGEILHFEDEQDIDRVITVDSADHREPNKHAEGQISIRGHGDDGHDWALLFKYRFAGIREREIVSKSIRRGGPCAVTGRTAWQDVRGEIDV